MEIVIVSLDNQGNLNIPEKAEIIMLKNVFSDPTSPCFKNSVNLIETYSTTK